jgi:hypothetical protein
MNRKEYLETAEKTICHLRPNVHGTLNDCFSLIADYWSVFLTQSTGQSIVLSASDVGVLMSLFKTARWQMNPGHQDNVVDAVGYWALAGELQDKDIYPKDDDE